MKKYILYILIFVFVFDYGYSEKFLSGIITENLSLYSYDNPVIFSGEVTINKGITLEINSGVICKFNKNSNLNIKGNLIANGLDSAQILFTANTSNPKTPFWGSLNLSSTDETSSIILKHCSFEFAGSLNTGAIIINPTSKFLTERLSISKCKYNGIEIKSGKYEQNITFYTCNIPYFLQDKLEISKNCNLHIYEGVILKFSQSKDLVSYGSISAIGTLEKPIIFTSLKDDSEGKIDTDGLGFTSGKTFDWGGIYLNNSQLQIESKFINCIFKFGGGSAICQNSLIFLDNSSPIFEQCQFIGNGIVGVYISSNSNPDLGGGLNNSKGKNSFESFTSSKYAIYNKSLFDISALYNCWGSNNDSSSISRIIYDKSDKDLYGKVNYNVFSKTCKPEVPKASIPLYPSNNQKFVKKSTPFKWLSSEYAEKYNFQLSKRLDFSEISLEINDFKDTSFIYTKIDPNTKYYWRIKAKNFLGESQWSEILQFETWDSTRPKQINLIFPPNNEQIIFCDLFLEWLQDNASEYYSLQIANDSVFKNIILNYDSLNSNVFRSKVKLDVDNIYYWRVAGLNDNGLGLWSNVRSFALLPCSLKDLPENWKYYTRTGDNCTYLFRKNDILNSLKFNSGDIIGAFYWKDSILYSGGVAKIDDSEIIPLTIWGDNKLTTLLKDGFNKNEYIRLIYRNLSTGEEIFLNPVFEKGTNFFITDSLSIIKGFTEPSTQKVKITANEWNYVSSYIEPYNPSLINQNRDLNFINQNFEIFSENLKILEFNSWQSNQGYQVYSNKPAEMIFQGNDLCYKENFIFLNSMQMNMIPIFSKESINAFGIFEKIWDKIHIIKDENGNSIIPGKGISQFSELIPGKSYKIAVKKSCSINFTPTDKSINIIPQQANSYFKTNFSKTGRNMTILLNSEEIADGFEVGVFKNNLLVGSGITKNKSCIINIWGDNFITKDIEGPIDGDILDLKIYDKIIQKERNLYLKDIIEVISEDEPLFVRFRNDAYYNAKISLNMTNVTEDGSNKLNINDNIIILDDFKDIELYDILGYLILKTENTKYINISELSHGLYFLKVKDYSNLKFYKICK
jgi:hypothetical protein